MNLKKILSEDEIHELARLSETGAGKALLKIAEAEIERLRIINEEYPRISDDGKNDFRFLIGEINGLKLAEKASRDARLLAEKTETR